MKKIILSIFIFIFLNSCVEEENLKYENELDYKKGAINNYQKVQRQKRKEIKSPTSSLTFGEKKDFRKKNKFNSVKSQNYNKIKDGHDFDYVADDIYYDFDEIFQNGKYIGHYKIGNTYKIEGIPYYPQEYTEYEEVGVASWYGEEFDGKATANGEIYNLDSMTAAHQTLPLPSIVKVTNLENGKSVIVRVNDRGPFAKNRIIDLSKKAAQVLEYKDKGTIMVRVEFLANETEEFLKKLNVKRQ